jgi:transposase
MRALPRRWLRRAHTNIVERSMRPQALTRKNALFAGHDDGAENWAILATLIETALCRARHKAVYADCRTMPNGLVFPGIHRERRVIGSA